MSLPTIPPVVFDTDEIRFLLDAYTTTDPRTIGLINKKCLKNLNDRHLIKIIHVDSEAELIASDAVRAQKQVYIRLTKRGLTLMYKWMSTRIPVMS